MPQNSAQFINIPINKGTIPDWNTRLGYSNLLNLFVGESGFLYSSPGLEAIPSSEGIQLSDIRQIHYTRFLGGTYIVITSTAVYRVLPSGGVVSQVGVIENSGLPVQVDENIDEQIGIVDGRSMYVYIQKTGVFEQLTEADNEFLVKKPISITILNNIAIVLDGETDGWYISSPNNMLDWPVLDFVPSIDSSLTKAVGLETLNNNLYIFGSTGIERWEPVYNTSPYLFPFAKDNNFRTDFGALSTNGIMRGATKSLSRIYFLSSQFVPMALTSQGISQLPDDKNMTGMAKIISEYEDVNTSFCCVVSVRGHYLVYFSFPSKNLSWVFCENSDAWAQFDEVIVSSLPTQEVLATKDNIFNALPTVIPDVTKHRRFQSERFTAYKGTAPYRGLISGIECRMVQGQRQSQTTQQLELTLSIDSESWLNTVTRPLPRVGKRNGIVVWQMNLAAYEYTIRLDYYGDMDITIEKVIATIQ